MGLRVAELRDIIEACGTEEPLWAWSAGIVVGGWKGIREKLWELSFFRLFFLFFKGGAPTYVGAQHGDCIPVPLFFFE